MDFINYKDIENISFTDESSINKINNHNLNNHNINLNK